MAEEQNRITPEIIQKCVAKEFSTEEKNVQILDLEVFPGAAHGDNFATVVKLAKFKYKINEEENLHSYIYKEVPFNEFREKFIRGSPIWKKEVVFYDTLMTRMQAIRKSIGKKELPFPKCFYASDEEGVIVLENLKTRGFKTVPKSPEGVPEDRLIKVLKEIAHFHSTTYHYLQQYPGGMEGLKKDDPDMFLSSFNDLMGDNEGMKKMMIESQSSFIKSAGKILQKYSKEFGADLNDRMTKFVDNDMSTLFEEAQLPRSEFKVILHGDLWYSNFMFSDNEDGSLKDIMLIDMQIMRIANPSIDLVYLLYSSSNNEARKEKLTEWLHIYHDALIDDLKTLGYSGAEYPFEELEKDIDHARLFGVMMGLMHCQVLQVTSKEDLDMDGMTEENMTEVMEKTEQRFVENAAKNEGLCKRMFGIAMEAKEKNLF